MGMINEVKQAFIDNIQEHPSKETVDISRYNNGNHGARGYL